MSYLRTGILGAVAIAVTFGAAQFAAGEDLTIGMRTAGTPEPVIRKLHDQTMKVLAMPDVRKTMEQQGLDIIGGSPEEFAAVIKKETPQWAKVIKEAGIKLSN